MTKYRKIFVAPAAGLLAVLIGLTLSLAPASASAQQRYCADYGNCETPTLKFTEGATMTVEGKGNQIIVMHEVTDGVWEDEQTVQAMAVPNPNADGEFLFSYTVENTGWYKVFVIAYGDRGPAKVTMTKS